MSITTTYPHGSISQDSQLKGITKRAATAALATVTGLWIGIDCDVTMSPARQDIHDIVWSCPALWHKPSRLDSSSDTQASLKPHHLTPAKQIDIIREKTGITIKQLSRLCGVSPRSIHNWANGSSMSAQHEEHLARIMSVVSSLPGSTPEERRAAFLDSSNGKSQYHQLVSARFAEQTLHEPALTVRERMRL